MKFVRQMNRQNLFVMRKHIVLATVAACLLVWSCSKVETGLNLKDSLEKGVADVNAAAGIISATKGFEMLTGANDPVKSDDVSEILAGFNDSITLDMVSGIYDFQPAPFPFHHLWYPLRLFKKSGTSEKMTVNLPEKLVFYPHHLHNCNLKDTTLENNFTISATDYHLYYTWRHDFDYELIADFELDSEPLGTLEMMSLSDGIWDNLWSSSYSFAEGYIITASHKTGETSEASFSLMKEDDILLRETRVHTRINQENERSYILTVGDVEIRRISGIDSIQVFHNGLLQKEAAAVIEDSDNATGSIFHRRDILLTFDDGTTVKLSEMISPALEALKSLSESIHGMYFARNVVDYIALNIYFNKQFSGD